MACRAERLDALPPGNRPLRTQPHQVIWCRGSDSRQPVERRLLPELPGDKAIPRNRDRRGDKCLSLEKRALRGREKRSHCNAVAKRLPSRRALASTQDGALAFTSCCPATILPTGPLCRFRGKTPPCGRLRSFGVSARVLRNTTTPCASTDHVVAPASTVPSDPGSAASKGSAPSSRPVARRPRTAPRVR